MNVYVERLLKCNFTGTSLVQTTRERENLCITSHSSTKSLLDQCDLRGIGSVTDVVTVPREIQIQNCWLHLLLSQKRLVLEILV